jgi:hypothetical protein
MKPIRLAIALAFFLVNAACAPGQTPAPPASVVAEAFECHVALSWTPSASTGITGYQLWRSIDGGQNYTFWMTAPATSSRAIDWTCDEAPAGVTRYYKIKAAAGGPTSDFSAPAWASTAPLTDDEWLDMVQRETFRYFWEGAHPVSGMARERSTSDDVVTTGGTGFGVMAIVVAVERGWITRQEGLDRLLQIVSFLQFADSFHGVFPHWMHGETGNVLPFSEFDDGGDLVETAFLMQGLLTARQYFNQDTPFEAALRQAINGLWEAVEWDWYRRNNSNVLYWHWSPNHGWQMNFAIRGFMEAQIVYILAVASPTHPVPASLYTTGWAGANYTSNLSFFGYPLCTGPFAGGPLFFAHYSYLGFDPRHKKDAYCNYFIRNRNHSLIHQAYAVANPENHEGYGPDSWGLTASDDPWGYQAHDITAGGDNGTLTPTAALSSMPYTPTESLAALKHFYRTYGEKLWGEYGFYDAFNPDENWYSNQYLAIDQGPIVVMIENHRSGLLWQYFMQSIEIQPALDAIGFMPDSTSNAVDEPVRAFDFSVDVRPSPAPRGSTVGVAFAQPVDGPVTWELWTIEDRLVQTNRAELDPGGAGFTLRLPDETAGLLLLKIITADHRFAVRKIAVR